MATRVYLGITDYVVIGLTLLISSAIGFLFSGRKQSTMVDYAMAGKNMGKIPVIFSITVTLTSATQMLINPAETYKYGTQITLKTIGVGIGMLLSSYLFVPVYFQTGVSTVYEYLEMRFGKLTRYTISAAFIIQMVTYMGVVLYAAVLSLSAVTNLSLEISAISLGLCCAFYSSIGGLKAVLWTDVFQSFLMCACVVVVCVAGIVDVDGISNIFSLSKAGQRLQFFNFSMNPIKRYTFWNCLLRGIWVGACYYGTGQAEVQRMLSMSTVDRAKSVLRLSILPVVCLQLLCDFMGLILYGKFHSCDPLLNRNNTGLTKFDQMIPYYIVTRVSHIPGLTGLCIAGIFSGSLSTISSALNSLATVTVMDFLKPFRPGFFNDRNSLLMAKFLSAMYGVICICCALMFSSLESIKQIVTTLMSLVEGPMVAIFIIAVLTRKASDRCTLFGFLVTLPIMAWIGIGSLVGKYSEPTLPRNINNCSSEFSSLNTTISDFKSNSSFLNINSSTDFSEMLILYKISFNWLPVLGTLITLTATFLAVIVTGWKRNVIPADSKCLSPVTRLWTRKSGANNEISITSKLQQQHGIQNKPESKL